MGTQEVIDTKMLGYFTKDRQYYIIGNTRIKTTEHLKSNGRTFDELLVGIIRNAAISKSL